jgi:hypothetical protein
MAMGTASGVEDWCFRMNCSWVNPNVAKKNDVRSTKRLAEVDGYWAKVIYCRTLTWVSIA